MVVFPGDLVQRGSFINYVYRWSDCNYEDGLEFTAMVTPLLWNDPKLTDTHWAEKDVGIVVYSIDDEEAACCLVLAPGAGLVWVPTECLQRIGTVNGVRTVRITGKRCVLRGGAV